MKWFGPDSEGSDPKAEFGFVYFGGSLTIIFKQYYFSIIYIVSQRVGYLVIIL